LTVPSLHSITSATSATAIEARFSAIVRTHAPGLSNSTTVAHRRCASASAS
jgi:hypothetical protein